MKETCWIYAAVSSGKQEATVADQLAWGNDTASKNGWEVIRAFHDVATGKFGTREILEDLLAALKATPKNQRPQRVLMIRLDRMGRGTGLDVIGAFGQIYKLGVTIHTRLDGDIPLDDPMHALKPIFDIWGAAKENRDRADKSRSMHARKRAAGEHAGLPSYGTVIVDKFLVPHEPEAGFIRDLFNLRLDGWGYARLARYLAPRAPMKTMPSGKRPMKWANAGIARMLQNPVYRGLIVPEEIFDAVQAMKRGEPAVPRLAKNPWPLRGALKCTCGQRMRVRLSGPGQYRTRYYVCDNVTLHQGYVSHRADTIEAQFFDLLQNLEAHPEILMDYTPPPDAFEEWTERRKALNREVEQLEQRKQRVWRLAEEGGLSGPQLKARLDEIEGHAAGLQETIREIDQTLAIATKEKRIRKNATELLRNLMRVWPNSDVTTQQSIASTVSAAIGGIWVSPEKRNVLNHGPHAVNERKAEASFPFAAIERFITTGAQLAATQEQERPVSYKPAESLLSGGAPTKS